MQQKEAKCENEYRNRGRYRAGGDERIAPSVSVPK